MRGLSERVRVLEDHLDLPAVRLERVARRARDVLARGTRSLPSVAFSSRSSVRPTVVLPQPDSPTRPSVSPREDVEREAVDRAHDRAARRERLQARRDFEIRLQPAHAHDRLRAVDRSSSTGGSSDARASPSPSAPTCAISSARTQAEKWPGSTSTSGGGATSRLGHLREAARREAAARRRLEQIRRHAFDRLELQPARPVEARHRAQQARGIGMQRLREELARRALLGHASPRT